MPKYQLSQLSSNSLKQHSPRLILTSRDLILHRIIPRLPHLRLEIHIHQLPLLGRPFPIRIPIVDDLAAPAVPHLDRRVRQRALRLPRDIVAGVFLDEEGLGAADVGVGRRGRFLPRSPSRCRRRWSTLWRGGVRVGERIGEEGGEGREEGGMGRGEWEGGMGRGEGGMGG